MKAGDLVTLSSRGWKLNTSQTWLRRVSARDRRLNELGYSKALEKHTETLIGLVLDRAPGPGEAFMIRWVKDGPRGPYDFYNYYSRPQNLGTATTRFERGHLKYVSKGKG